MCTGPTPGELVGTLFLFVGGPMGLLPLLGAIPAFMEPTRHALRWGVAGSSLAFLWAVGLALRLGIPAGRVDGAGDWAMVVLALGVFPLVTALAAGLWVRAGRPGRESHLPRGALAVHATLLLFPLVGAFLALGECTNPSP